jgi:tetratricopeptide (TPR) repeat protein
MLRGDARGAIAVFDRALTLDPTLVEARFNRAVALMKTGDFTRASADFEKIAENAETHLQASAAYHNALALDRMGRPADAEFWLQRALVADPKLDAATLYLGLLREKRGDLAGAARNYLDYLKQKPDSLVASLRLGVSAHRAGRTDVARTYLRRVIDKAPNSPEAVEARKFLVMWD